MPEVSSSYSECRFSRVAVLKGGPGAEREVSLKSGAAVADALRTAGLEVDELDVTGVAFEVPEAVEAVFPVLHGAFGEDGVAQARLEELGFPYVGSRSWEMPRSFDKEITHALLEKAGIPMADWCMIEPGEAVPMPAPLVLKAPRQGSSIGLEIVMNDADILEALERVRAFDPRVLAEDYVPGREVTVGFMGDQILPIVEIRPATGTYDYEAKYQRSDTEYLVPAPLSEEQEALLKELAAKTFRVLGGRHVGRVDFRVTEQGPPSVLELNPLPGFTATSLLPKAAAAFGIDFPSLCVQLINLAETSPSHAPSETYISETSP